MPDLKYEKKFFKSGYRFLAGLDEAGRGPLAGPVVAACIIIDKKFAIPPELKSVNDSKRLTSRQREELFPLIKKHIKHIGVGVVPAKAIDKANIWKATKSAMKKAVDSCCVKPDMALIDGKIKNPLLKIDQLAIVGGDSICFSIAAASIIAKVHRDKLMEKLHEKYPAYGFSRNKGYGTKAHIEAIKKFKACPEHRQTFAPINSLFK